VPEDAQRGAQIGGTGAARAAVATGDPWHDGAEFTGLEPVAEPFADLVDTPRELVTDCHRPDHAPGLLTRVDAHIRAAHRDGRHLEHELAWGRSGDVAVHLDEGAGVFEGLRDHGFPFVLWFLAVRGSGSEGAERFARLLQ